MKYIVDGKKNIERMSDDELLNEILRLRGVEDPHALLNISHKTLHDPRLFRFMEQGVELYRKHIQNNSKIYVLADSDSDGLTSAGVVWLYTYFHSGIECCYDTHEKKQHGLYREVYERIPKDVDLVIIPDASSGQQDIEWIEKLMESGADVLILDHHTIKAEKVYHENEEMGTVGMIINCQDGLYPNPTLSGVGVVYKFFSLYDELYGNDNISANDFLELVSWGMIADAMDMRNPETRFLALEGLKTMQNTELIKLLLEKQSIDVENVTPTTVGWKIAPFFNATFRVGEREDKLDMFEALCGFQRECVHFPSRKTKDNPDKLPIHESLQANVIRRMTSFKSKQNNKESVERVNQLIKEQGLQGDKIIIVDTTGMIEQTQTGLTAQALVEKYLRPVILLTRRDSNTYGGSMRAYELFPIVDILGFINNSGVGKAEGHEGASGVTFTNEQVPLFREYCAEVLKDVSIEPVHHVDFEFNINKLKEKHIKQVGQWEDFFGGKYMHHPTFAIKGIVIDSADIIKNKSFVKFSIERNGEVITFVKRFASDEWYKTLIHETGDGKGVNRDSGVGNKKLEITVIGKFTINKWNDKEFPQIEIEEIESTIMTGRKRRF